MANPTQIIKHKRSAAQGVVPDTGSLLIGEIGLNTNDGKAFLHKSGSAGQKVVEFVVTDAVNSGSINISGTGSFGELVVSQDINVTGSVFVNNDIVGLGDLDVVGAVSASIVSASTFIGDGSQLTGVTASMRPDDFDFNSEPFAGTIGYIQGSGSLYKVATVSESIQFRYNDSVFATVTTAYGFSGSLYGIGDVLAFSGSVAARLQAVEAGSDGGEF